MKLHQRMGDVPIDLRQLVPAEYFPFRDVEAWEDTRVGLEPGPSAILDTKASGA